MSYKFTRFINTGVRLSNNTISLSQSQQFFFNSGFYTKENIRKYKKVVLFYDPNKTAVAFLFTNDLKAEGAYTVVHGNARTTGSVTARSFVTSNDLNKKEYFGKKTPKKINDENLGTLYVIDLFDNSKENSVKHVSV